MSSDKEVVMAITSHADKVLLETSAASSAVEAIGGIAAIVLTILGLIGISPGFMASVTTIVLGAAFLMRGGPMMAEYRQVMSRLDQGQTMVASGLSAEVVAGAAGIVLGILALLQIAPMVLVPCALLIFGAGLVMNSGSMAQLDHLRLSSLGAASLGTGEHLQRASSQVTLLASGAEILLGITAVVLGVLALVSIDPMVLTLVGLLTAGVAALFVGTTIGGRVASKWSGNGA
jgi:hypothetical protein